MNSQFHGTVLSSYKLIKRFPFRVDIAGIIELMGSSLYSRMDVAIRELIQNSHDGIMRRRQGDLTYRGRIDIRQDANRGVVTFDDDGIGLTAAEAEEYLGTLGAGITGMIKRGVAATGSPGDANQLIGQFGVGLFSAFMLAGRVVVESRRVNSDQPIRWEAGPGTEIELSMGERQSPGTTVTLYLKPEHRPWCEKVELLEAAVRDYADFLPLPIYLNDAKTRANVSNAVWFEATPDREALELELESYFHETPLDVIPLRIETPAVMQGALYVTPQRVPGFGDEPAVAATVRRMVISRKIQGILPSWATFLRGLIELPDAAPTTSREDLVHDQRFERARETLEELLFAHFERLAVEDAARLVAVIAWHRYTLAGAALSNARLRRLLRSTYRFTTSDGDRTFEQILERSPADPLFDSGLSRVVWYNPDRRQEQWMSGLFAATDTICVHTLRSFEHSLLAAMAADEEPHSPIDLRIASPRADGFAPRILAMRDFEEAPHQWQDFLSGPGIKVFVASFDPNQPAMAFLNERRELKRTLDTLKKEGTIPAGFQRMIDTHFQDDDATAGEIVLNRQHRLVRRALSQATGSPLAGVLRLLVVGALQAAGLAIDRRLHQNQADDLEWIADVLWGSDE